MPKDNLAFVPRDAFEQIDDVIHRIVRPAAEEAGGGTRSLRPSLKALSESGWTGVLTEPRHGGLGLDHAAFAEAASRIGHADVATALAYVMHVGASHTIGLFGSDAQKSRWLRPGPLGTFSTSEGATNGHWWFNVSEAGRDGDGYVLNATKSFTTASGEADYYVMQTRTPGARDQADLTFFIVDGRAPGLEPDYPDPSGPRAGHQLPMRYRNVRVGPRDRLGREGQGKDIIHDGVSPIYLLGVGAVWEGLARASLDAAARHAIGLGRKDYNRGIAEHQASRQLLGDAKVLVETLRPWRNELAARLDGLWQAGRPQREILVPFTVFGIHAAEVANRVASIALTITGGYGYGRSLAERLYRDARMALAMSPSNVIAKDWIGKTVVGLPLELV